jgi:FkbM family methyltransferase
MDLIKQQLLDAVACMKTTRVRKLIHPGIHKFIWSYLLSLNQKSRLHESTLFFGRTMDVALPEVISTSIYMYGYFDEIVSMMAIESIKNGDTVLDVGAHIGYFTLLFSHLTGDRGKVYSFEPTPSTYELLLRNTRSIKNVSIINAAVGAEEGTQQITDFGLKYCAWNTLANNSRLPDMYGGLKKSQKEVKIITLDTFLGQQKIRPDVIKIDAENYEFHVVSGMAQTLNEFHPRIIMECGSESSLRAAKILQQMHYSLNVFDEKGELRQWEGSLEDANAKYKDILFLP